MEYQAKELFAKHGVTTTLGVVVETADAARTAAEELGGVTVVKAQVKAGGRGKAGGVKLAKTADEAEEHASRILGMEIKGLRVNRVLVTPATPPVEEYYFSFLLDRANRSHLCIASVEGGVEIEEVAKTNPDAVRKIPVNALEGVTPTIAAAIVDEAKFPAELRDQAIEMVQQLWKVYVEEDATLVEVNPLARLEGDKLEALDGKVSLDDNASEVRHPEHEQFEIREEADPLEAKAKDKGLNYVKLDGQVGIIGNGAGLVMSTLDVVAYAGEDFGGVRPANFLDIGGGASAEVMANGLHIILSDPAVKSVFVNVFGGITACDAVANGTGAGLVMTTLDVVAYAGENSGGVRPANSLAIGGGASAGVMAKGLHIILSAPAVKSVFVNVFGGITACDAVANGIVSALQMLGDEATKPLVVRLDGNNVEEGRRILAEANHPLVTVVDTMDGAARRAAELAAA